MHQTRPIAWKASRELAWLALPFSAYLFLLGRLWFDAPIQDDYQAILGDAMRLADSRGLREWLQVLFSQHNEHRIVVTRAAAWAFAELTGRIDFRMLVVFGNLSLLAIIALLWVQFRDAASAVLVAAAGFFLCQLIYYEGALMAMAASSNMVSLAAAMATFYFALRPGRGGLGWSLVFGVLAAGSQANGLFALPIAAISCALRRAWLRAGTLTLASILVWVPYMAWYQLPPAHPSMLTALDRPLDALRLFLIFVGAFAPGPGPATAFGAALLAMLAWLATKGFWRERPSIAAFVLFVLLSAAAGAVSRAGFGVFWASRYAVNSSCLVAIVFLLLVVRRTWTPSSSRRLLAAAAVASLALSWVIWPYASAYSARGRSLAKLPSEDPDARTARYVGVDFPDYQVATRLLSEAEDRSLYFARRSQAANR